MIYHNIDNPGDYTNNERLAKLKVKNGQWKSYNILDEEIVLDTSGQYVRMSEFINSVTNIANLKLLELKNIRDSLETENVETNKGIFDFNQSARERIVAAIIAMDLTNSKSINWTLADNTDVELKVNDLKKVMAVAAKRSDKLHKQYRNYYNSISQYIKDNNIDAIKTITWEKDKDIDSDIDIDNITDIDADTDTGTDATDVNTNTDATDTDSSNNGKNNGNSGNNGKGNNKNNKT